MYFIFSLRLSSYYVLHYDNLILYLTCARNRVEWITLVPMKYIV